MSEQSFLSTLMSRRPGLDALAPAWRMIDDVIAGDVKRRGPSVLGGFDERGADAWYSPYFPKGRLEPEREYSLRIELTPFFPQTPQILASRLGALFRSRLQIDFPTPSCDVPSRDREGAEPLANARGSENATMRHFLLAAGRRHTSFEDFAVQAACLAQAHGFCAALLDRDPLPADTRERAPSAAEAAARNLGRPYLALYAADEILDWDFGSDGLLNWVKFGETEFERPSWDAPPVETLVYRIVDRTAIHVYRVRRNTSATPHPLPLSPEGRGENGGGDYQIQAAAPVPHGFVDKVPVAFIHPFPGRDGIGRPILQRAAESDLASARILSDLVWDLFLLGNPILTLKTARGDEEQKQLCLGATRYIPLRNGRPGIENEEKLEFVQLNPTGLEMMFRAHDMIAGEATSIAGMSNDIAAVPKQQSGVAQAWRFKTGEERILFMLARALEPFLTKCLALANEALGMQAPAPVVRMPESFDIATPQDSLQTAAQVLALAQQLGQTELAKTALARIEESLGGLAPETREALGKERAGLKLTGVLKPQTNADGN